MKILLSAYACEPDRGSEPGVGWNWAMELSAKGHDVWVITRANNKPVIEEKLNKLALTNPPRFIYCDLPQKLRFWKKAPGGVNIYYTIWQYIAFFKARKTHQIENFQLVHHITFGSFRQSSLMGLLGIPFIFGPVGGGESCPAKLRESYSTRGRIIDFARDLFNLSSRINPMFWIACHKASDIVCKTKETKASIPKRFHHKTSIALEIGIPYKDSKLSPVDSPYKLLFVGRLIFLKGGQLAIHALKMALEVNPNLELTFLGQGMEKDEWQELAKNLGISQKIHWLGHVPKVEVDRIYQDQHIFLFPSLRDSSGNVILEAASHGLPSICLDVGGPGSIVDDSFGIKASCDSKTTIEEASRKLSEAIIELSTNSELYQQKCIGALDKAKNSSWADAVDAIYAKWAKE
ncbi:MAG: glycosyltransferase family 4 protein [Planctomycetes bacterium]|nr:glycosyltransferase family 4 protein [Planctomycetota bacterium]